MIQQQNIRPGSLLALTTPSEEQPYLVFLAPVVCNPRKVVLALANHKPEEDTDSTKCYSFMGGNRLLPHFRLSTAVFKDLLANGMATVSVAQVPYVCKKSDFHKFQVHACDPGPAHPLEKEASTRLKRPVQLPFGFKLARRARLQPSKKSSNPCKTSKQTQQSKVHEILSGAAASSHGARKTGATPVSSSSSGDSDGDGDGHGDCVDSDDHGDDAAANDDTELPSELAAENQTVNRSLKRSTYFSKEIGFTEIAIQGRHKALCLHCEQRIQPGSFRLAFHFHLKSPSRWIHAACVMDLLRSKLASHPELGEVFFHQLSSLQAAHTCPDTKALLESLTTQLEEAAAGSGSASSRTA